MAFISSSENNTNCPFENSYPLTRSSRSTSLPPVTATCCCFKRAPSFRSILNLTAQVVLTAECSFMGIDTRPGDITPDPVAPAAIMESSKVIGEPAITRPEKSQPSQRPRNHRIYIIKNNRINDTFNVVWWIFKVISRCMRLQGHLWFRDG